MSKSRIDATRPMARDAAVPTACPTTVAAGWILSAPCTLTSQETHRLATHRLSAPFGTSERYGIPKLSPRPSLFVFLNSLAYRLYSSSLSS